MSARPLHVTLRHMPSPVARALPRHERGRACVPVWRVGWLAALAWCTWHALTGPTAHAQQGTLELSFTPTDRVQLAVWVERDDGQFMATLALTSAVSVEGIGNRPGALEMNSGFRWPYGRREGVLPVWAHRRAAAPGAKQFQRVIFQNRTSEGDASRTTADNSVDDYYCLSFKRDSTGRDALDAVTCASVFSSDKGRFITDADVARNYAEPFQDEQGNGTQRPLSLTSLYPPRRDVTRCTASGCYDHADVSSYAQHARDVMPEIDAVSQATPQGEFRVTWSFPIPEEWSSAHKYTLFIEANVEGDYNDHWNDQRFPTPTKPDGAWDSWAMTFGYPYRGQPSVVYALPFSFSTTDPVTTRLPAGYGALHGDDGDLRPFDATISDDPVGAKGSGADRLLDTGGVRATLRVLNADPCAGPDSSNTCGMACDAMPSVCGSLYCDPNTHTCMSYCAATAPPSPVQALTVSEYPDRERAHMWARLSFQAPQSQRPISGYDVKVKPEGGDWGPAFTHDAVQELLPVALDVCTDPSDPTRNRCLDMQAGTPIVVDLAGLKQSTHYTVSVAARDGMCSDLGQAMMAEYTTPARTFTTVSPCFIATAAYGSPLAAEIGVLRRMRDRHLASHALGRRLIATYYRLGPELASFVREHDWMRALARALLWPIVSFARMWDG